MNRPSICFVAPKAYPVLARSRSIEVIGGAEVQQCIIARELVRKGYVISMVCSDYGQKDRARIDDIVVHKVNKSSKGIRFIRFFHPRMTSLWKAMRRADADIYYQRGAGVFTGLVAAFCKLHGKKFVHAGALNVDFIPGKCISYERDSLIDSIKSHRNRLIYRLGLTNADVVIVQNQEQQRLCKDNYKIGSILIPSCYKAPEHTDENEPCDVLWVSNIRRRKRPEIFIRLAGHFREHRFKMIGGSASGKGATTYYRKIERMAQGVKNLAFFGFVNYYDIDRHFDGAKIFANTSKYEGFPNTFLQTWARGIPTVSFFDTGARSKGRTIGWNVRNEEEAVLALRTFMIDAKKREETGRICREYFEANHSVGKVISDYSRIFESLSKMR